MAESAGDLLLEEISTRTAGILCSMLEDMVNELVNAKFEEAKKDYLEFQAAPPTFEPKMLVTDDLRKIFNVSLSTLNIGVRNGRYPPPVFGGGTVGGRRRYWNAQDVSDTVRLGSWTKVTEERAAHRGRLV